MTSKHSRESDSFISIEHLLADAEALSQFSAMINDKWRSLATECDVRWDRQNQLERKSKDPCADVLSEWFAQNDPEITSVHALIEKVNQIQQKRAAAFLVTWCDAHEHKRTETERKVQPPSVKRPRAGPPIQNSDDQAIHKRSLQPPTGSLSTGGDEGFEVFISHSGNKKAEAFQICLRLEALGHHCFFDRLSLRPSRTEFESHIRAAISKCQVFVAFICSEFFRAEWPVKELQLALDRKDCLVLPIFECGLETLTKVSAERPPEVQTLVAKIRALNGSNNVHRLDSEAALASTVDLTLDALKDYDVPKERQTRIADAAHKVARGAEVFPTRSRLRELVEAVLKEAEKQPG